MEKGTAHRSELCLCMFVHLIEEPAGTSSKLVHFSQCHQFSDRLIRRNIVIKHVICSRHDRQIQSFAVR